MRRIGIIGLLIVLFTASGCATITTTTGVIRGRLDVTEKAGETRPRDLGEAIVYVEKLEGEGFEAPPPSAARVMTRSNTFVPRVIAVAAGSSVEFHNSDRVYHNAFSVSQSKRFDLGAFAPGTSHSVKFDKPGIVNLYCELHSDETGIVLVLTNPVFAQADATGTFALPPLPRGDYTVKAWHPRLGERRARIQFNGVDDVNLHLRF